MRSNLRVKTALHLFKREVTKLFREACFINLYIKVYQTYKCLDLVNCNYFNIYCDIYCNTFLQIKYGAICTKKFTPQIANCETTELN